jgi:uncharacterized NAD(P)/FAD-binding protein YdhS
MIVPRHVLEAGQTAPSDLIHIAILGTGGQGLVNMLSLLQQPDVRIIAIAERVGGKPYWDSTQMRFTNSNATNDQIKPHFRKGWEI